MNTTAEITVSPIERIMDAEGRYGADHATVTGPNGTTRVTGCLGVSPSGRYRVYFTWKHGAVPLTSSTIIEADSAIEAAIKDAIRTGGGHVSSDAGTAEIG
jgi:hypothetical protein